MSDGAGDGVADRQWTAIDGAGTALVAGFSTLTVGLAAFGAVTGGLTRMLRNYPGLSLSSAILISIAIGLGIISKMLVLHPSVAIALIAIGTVLFVIGLALGVGAATQTPKGKQRPQLTASFNDEHGLNLVGEVTAADLTWDNYVDVLVQADAVRSGETGDAINWHPLRILYIAHVGPNEEGNVSVKFNIPVRPEKGWDTIFVSGFIERPGIQLDHACNPNSSKEIGCLSLRLPLSHKPQVTATLGNRSGGAYKVDYQITAHDVPAAGMVRTWVVRRTATGDSVLARGALSPDNKGNVTATQSVSVPTDGGGGMVCVLAERTYTDQEDLTMPMSRQRCPANTDSVGTASLSLPAASRRPADP